MEIPGYWYDDVKKRYFRITNNPVQPSTFVSLARKAKEEQKSKRDDKRKKHTVPVMTSNLTPSIALSHSPFAERLQRPCVNGGTGINRLLTLREYQHRGLVQSRRLVYLSVPRLLDAKCVTNLYNFADPKLMAINSDGTLLVMYVEQIDKMFFFKLCFDSSAKANDRLSMNYKDSCLLPTSEVVTDIQFVSQNGEELLAYSSCSSQNGGVKVCRLPGDDERCVIKLQYRMDNDYCFTFSWNSATNYILLGGSYGACLRSLEAERYSKYISTASNVLSSQLSTVTSYVACGTRNGSILLWDIRSLKQHDSTPLFGLHVRGKFNSSVTCLNMLRDENYLISTSANGKLLQWDLRMRRVALLFCHGVKDESNFSYTKSIIDSGENYLISVVNSSVNIWSLQNGSKLRTLAAAYADMRSTPICFTHNFAGSDQCTPVLITAADGGLIKAYSI